MQKLKTPQCSFCGASKKKSRYLIAAKDVYICNKCILLACGILVESIQDDARRDLAKKRWEEFKLYLQ